MPRIPTLIEELRRRSDLTVSEQKEAWLVRITKNDGLVCKITVPFHVLEWFADVKREGEDRALWADWMDYSGYDDRTEEKLEADMADDVLAFIQRLDGPLLHLPLQIYQKKQPNQAPQPTPLKRRG